MKPRTVLKRIYFAAFTLLVFSTAAPACDDGNLNTIMEVESLRSYMEEHSSLRLYVNAVSNYREPLYICAYDMGADGEAITPNPVGRYGSTGGIPYGEVTAVEITESLPDKGMETIFVRNWLDPCPATLTEAMENQDFVAEASAGGGETDDSVIMIATGYVSASKGGEDWRVCGESGTESCESELSNGSASTSLLPNPPKDPSNTNLMTWSLGDMFTRESPTRTFCWTDTAGTTLRIGLNPMPYEPPYTGWVELPPLEEGTIHLHDGDVDCDAVTIEDAVATTVLPFDATFGPDGSKIAYEAGTSGMLLIIGQSYPGIPAEAGLRIIPLLNWKE